MATTYFRFPPSKTIYRVVNAREFMGFSGTICDVIAESGRPAIEILRANQMTDAVVATADEWSAAEALALKVQAKAEADRIFREDAERYGVKVVAAGDHRGAINLVIVRVTKARYVDANGNQWKRLRNKGRGVDGQRVGDFGRWYHRPFLSDSAIDAIESACGGADVYDFIKAGKRKAIAGA